MALSYAERTLIVNADDKGASTSPVLSNVVIYPPLGPVVEDVLVARAGQVNSRESLHVE